MSLGGPGPDFQVAHARLAAPEVSVVMAVRNEADTLGATIDSLLAQEGPSFEVVVVDDGSQDDSLRLLGLRAALDHRLVVCTQPATGLTAALRRGCEAARGRFIARHDAGQTRAFAGRLALPARVLRERPDVELASCGVRWIAPGGEFLYDVVRTAEDAEHGLLHLEAARLRGPAAHPAAMFRRATYERVGGYREAFRVAQDLDLWLRLREAGTHVALPEVLLEECVRPRSISGLHRKMQLELTEYALACARARRAGESEAAVLARAAARSRDPLPRPTRREEAAGQYHLARLLHAQHPRSARRAYVAALRRDPRCWKAAVQWVRAWWPGTR